MNKTIIFGIVLTVIDYLWLTNYMAPAYQDLFKINNLKLETKIPFAIIAYLLLVSVYPFYLENLNGKELINNAIRIGILIYGVYGFTLAAILPNYNLDLAMTESVWGAVLYSSSSFLTEKIISHFKIQ